MGTQLTHFQNDGRQHTDDEGFACADPESPGNLLRLLGNAFCFPDRIEDFQGVGQQAFSCLCQFDLFADPLKELGMQFGLELFDLHGYGRLGISKLLGCLGKVLYFRDSDKGHKISDFHIQLPPWIVQKN